MGLLHKLKSIDYDELLSYQTVKFLRIHDKRLGLLHYAIQLAIFAYIIVVSIIIEQRYLRTEPPYGSIRATLKEPVGGWIAASTLPYCFQNQPEYSNFSNLNCTYLRGSDIPFPPADIESIFISTRIKDSYYPVSPNCTDYDMTTLECAPVLNASKIIRYSIAGIESYTIYIEHAIFGRINQLLFSNFDCIGTLHLKNNSSDISFNDPTRTGDILTIGTLLNAAGISSLDEPSGLGNSYRYDGVLMVVVISYSNYVTEPSKFYYTYDLYTIPKQDVLSMQPSKKADGIGTVQRNWYGIRTIFLVVGQIGVFDFPTLLVSLVSGLVLINVATVVVDILILYILPKKKTYQRHKFELTDVSAEEKRGILTNLGEDDE